MQINALNTTLFDKLSNKECIIQYGVAARGSLLYITETLPEDHGSSMHQYTYWPAEYNLWSRSYSYFAANLVPHPQDPQNLKCNNMNKNTQTQDHEFERCNEILFYCFNECIESQCKSFYRYSIPRNIGPQQKTVPNDVY